MDSTDNECPEEVTGYPKLVFYPAVSGGEKVKMRKKVVYSGKRDTAQDLLSFIEESAKNLEDDDQKTAEKPKKSKVSPMLQKELDKKNKEKAAGDAANVVAKLEKMSEADLTQRAGQLSKKVLELKKKVKDAEEELRAAELEQSHVLKVQTKRQRAENAAKAAAAKKDDL